MAEPNFAQTAAQKYPRLIGLGMLILSGYLLYDGFISPMLQIRSNAPEVTFSSEKEFFLGVSCTPVALALIITGEKFISYMTSLREKHGPMPFYILGAVLGLGLLGLHFVFEHYLNNLGYHEIQSGIPN